MATRGRARRAAVRRRYTADEKRLVVDDARTLGVCGAAKKHGVHQTNVSRWLKASKTKRPAGAAVAKIRRERTAKKYTPSQIAQALEYAAEHGVGAASEK